MSRKRTRYPENVDDILSGLGADSDRGCVLIAASWLDKLLEDRLCEHFKKSSGISDDELKTLVSGDFAVLGAIANRARMAMALGLIFKDVYAALRILVDLRNHCAHHPGLVTLTSDRVAQIADKLDEQLEQSNLPRHLALRIVPSSETIPIFSARSDFLVVIARLRHRLKDPTVEARITENAMPPP